MAPPRMLVPCPLCGRDKYMKKPRQLYGQAVCKKCVGAFCSRRQVAYLVDLFVGYMAATVILAAWVFFVVAVWPQTRPTSISNWPMYVVPIGFLLIKDGSNGRSPGKMLLGLQVLKTDTGLPCNTASSIKRNIATILPLVPLIIAGQMYKGPRLGDREAKTKVIWRRYAEQPIFRAGTEPAEPDLVEVELLQAELAAAPPPAAGQSQNPYQSPRL